MTPITLKEFLRRAKKAPAIGKVKLVVDRGYRKYPVLAVTSDCTRGIPDLVIKNLKHKEWDKDATFVHFEDDCIRVTNVEARLDYKFWLIGPDC